MTLNSNTGLLHVSIIHQFLASTKVVLHLHKTDWNSNVFPWFATETVKNVKVTKL